jgi:hypothetical protein
MEIEVRPVAAVSLAGPVLAVVAPGRRLVAVRTDAALTVHDLDSGGAEVARFPAPWPAGAGGVDAVSPALDLAVFSGLHAVRAVGADGATHWEISQACWGCGETHATAEEHEFSDSGSAGFAADGRTVWAHVRLQIAAEDTRGEGAAEAWLVIDPATGAVLARADLQTYSAGSEHIAHPAPGVMGLSVGEGQDGAPTLWGHWDGAALRTDQLDGDDRALIGAGPGGRTFLTLGHEQPEELAVHRMAGHEVLGTVLAEDSWDPGFGVVDDRTVIVGAGADHWLIDVDTLEARGPLRYPAETGEILGAFGDGTWLTSTPGTDDVTVWRAEG